MVLSDLNEGEYSFRRLAENLPGIVYRVLIEDDNRTIFFNDMVQTMTGYRPEDLKRGEVCSIDPIIVPEDKLNVINIVKDAIDNNVPFEVEYRINNKSGELKWFFERGRPIRGDNGNPSYIEGVIFDITERKETEQKLKESEKKFKLFYENAPLGYQSLDSNGNILEVNKAWINFFGYSKEEVIGKFFGDFIDSEYLEVFNTKFLKFMETGELCEIEFEIIKKDGSHAIVLFNGNINFDENGNFKRTHCIFQDITEQKQIQKEIREKQATLESIFRAAPIGIGVVKNRVFTQVNDRFCRLVGYTRNELLNRNTRIIYPSDEEYEYVGKEKYAQIAKFGIGTVETRFQRKDGIIINILLSSVQSDSNNLSAGVTFTALDITERKKAEQKLKSEKEKAQKYLDIAGVIIIALNADQTVQLINQKGCEILEEEESKIIGMNWFDNYIPENVREQVKKYFNQIISGEIEPLEYYENAVISKNGKKRIISWHNRTLKNKAGQIIGTLSSGLDITARKQSEENFRKQNVFLNNILESLTHPFYVINAKDYTVALANSSASSEGLEFGQFCYSLTHNNDKPCEAPCQCPLDEVKKTKRACVVEHKHYDKEGNEKIYEIYGFPILDESGNVVQMIEYALNISDRKKAEKYLRKIAHQWRTTFDAMSESVFLLDIEKNILQCNKATLDILGKEKYDEIIGHSCCEIIHGTNEPVEWCPMIRMIESSHKESSIAQIGDKWCEISVDPVINDEGILIGAVHIITDITERRKTEAALRGSEEKFRTIAERTLMGILIIQDNQVKYANDALLNIFEYSQKEILNWEKDDLTKLIHSEDFPFLREYREHLRSGDKSFKPYNSYRVFTKSGKIKWIDQFSKEILYRGRLAELITIMDITEKKEVEHELIKLNNLKSELLRRTSHELRTPLVSIKGFSDLLLELHRDKLDDYVIRTINQIRMGCNRLESLVNNILKTAELESGTVELKKSKEDLSLLIKICVSELEGLSKLRNHTINLEISDNLICSFEKDQIYNVITNILSNAIKFTPYNGKIEVKSEIKNDFIIVSIKDNGIGFSKEEGSLLFKQFGKIERYGQGYDVISEGSGLGLYISKKIIELHGGEIWIESEGRDKGSTFYFSLPII